MNIRINSDASRLCRVFFLLLFFVATPGYTQNANTVVLSLAQYHDLLPPSTPSPLIEVYADGRVQITRPVFMKNAGTFEHYLSRAQMDALINSVTETGLLNFDAAQVKAQCDRLAAAEDQVGKVFAISDADHTVVKLNLGSTASDALATNTNDAGTQEIAWTNLNYAVERFPGVSSLQALKQTADMVSGLANTSAMQKIN